MTKDEKMIIKHVLIVRMLTKNIFVNNYDTA